jgi:hypothetical protein
LLLSLYILLSLYMLLAVDVSSFALRRVGWSRFVSTFLLFYAQIIATEFLLGLFSVLGSYSLIALNAALTTGVILFLRKKFGVSLFTRYLTNIRRALAHAWKDVRRDPFWLALLLLALGFVCWIIFLGIIFPVTDYDGNGYHLTFVANMIQSHTFFDAPSSSLWVTGYPKGGEFIEAWSVLITHNDMLADLVQVPFLLLAVYALYDVATMLGVGKRQARFSALLFAFLPVVLNQLKTTYVDVMLCSVFFAGLALAIRKKLGKLDLALIGIVFSLLIAIKSTGLFFVLTLLPFLFWNLYTSYGKSFKRYIRPTLLVITPMFFGIYWYVKNFVLYGSPLYPFGLKAGGITIFPGKNFQASVESALQLTSLPHGCVQRIWFVWTEQKDWFGCLYNYDTNYTGLGPIWFIILIPAIVVSVYFAIKQRNALYLAIAAAIAALFSVYPANFYSRYTIFITAVGILALGIVLTNIGRLTANVVKGVIIVLAVSVIATNFTLCNFSPRVIKDQLKSERAGSARGAIYSINPGAAYVFLEGRVKPKEVVAYSSKPFFIYPLWTPDFSDTVLYFPANSVAAWYQQIARKHVKYVFATRISKENKWASDRMKAIYKDETYEIFQTY